MAAAARTRDRDRDAAPASPPSDAYVGLLGISLGALILGCVLLFLDYNEYSSAKPTQAPAYTGLPDKGGAVQADPGKPIDLPK